MAFSDPAGNYPASYDNGLFFADYTRSCIGVIPGGVRRPPRSGPGPGVRDRHLRCRGVGDRPDKNLWWVDLGGHVHRVTVSGGIQAPVARISANPTNGPVPLAVSFDGRGSSDPDGATRSPPTPGTWTATPPPPRPRTPIRRLAATPPGCE